MSFKQQKPQAESPQPPDGFPRERRFIFVQLLFSLTAAEIARVASELFQVGANWSALPAWVHILLATAVVVTSWVGWSVSESSLRVRVNSVFSFPFLVLLIDVLLVVLYFNLVRGAEVPKANLPATPSAKIECDMIATIFFVYFLWDFLTKAVLGGQSSDSLAAVLGRLRGSDYWRRSWQSVVCFSCGLLAWVFLRGTSGLSSVLLLDFALICLVLFFRASKEGRFAFSRFFAIAFVVLGVAAWLTR